MTSPKEWQEQGNNVIHGLKEHTGKSTVLVLVSLIVLWINLRHFYGVKIFKSQSIIKMESLSMILMWLKYSPDDQNEWEIF